jgi:hypothetical protein
VQCVNVVPKGEIVSGEFTVREVQISAVAEVRSSRPTIGMGLRWCDLGWNGREKLNNVLRTLSLHHTESISSKQKALAQLNKLQQAVTALRERLESNHTPVDIQMLGRLNDAEEKLEAALKSVQV